MRCDTSWANNRQRLADCTVGFGRGTIGGKNGKTYVVTDPSDDADPASPAPGTLRYGLVQQEPLWITFARDMTIRPKQDLLVASYKTVDGRGAGVVVGDGGACFVLRNVSNVIIHGLTIRGCRPAPALSPTAESEGDGITVFRSTNVWVDHCTLEACADGLTLPDHSYFLTAVNRQEKLKTRQEIYSCRPAVRTRPTGTARQERATFSDGQPTGTYS
jgi:pectate lyase